MKTTINSLSVRTEGSSNNKAIIFIHGFPFDKSMWKNQIESLKDDYYCVSYDVRGLGKSYVGDGQYTMQAFALDLFSVMAELKLKKPIVCGLSMGGYIALRAIEMKENKFSGLLLMDTKSAADNNEAKLKRAHGIDQINVKGLESFVKGFVPNCFAEATRKDKVEMYREVKEKACKHNKTGVKGALLAMLSRTDTTNYLKEISIPTLVLVGSFDKLTPPTVMRNMAEQIKGAEFAIAPRAGHLPPLENPSFVNDMLKGFIKRRIK